MQRNEHPSSSLENEKATSLSDNARGLVVVVATPIEYHKTWYETHLRKHNIDVIGTSSVVECLEAVHNTMPNVIVIELEQNGSCSQDVLRARNVIDRFKRIPVILIARGGVRSCLYDLSSFVVQGFFSRMPCADELADCIFQLGDVSSTEGVSS